MLEEIFKNEEIISKSQAVDKLLWETYVNKNIVLTNELLDELTRIRFDYPKDMCNSAFVAINIFACRIVLNTVIHANDTPMFTTKGDKFINILGDTIPERTFYGHWSYNDKKIILMKGIFYAQQYVQDN